jgi:molybdopterin converting factor small subunit
MERGRISPAPADTDTRNDAPMTTTNGSVQVRVTAVLQKLVDGQKIVEAHGDTVGDVFNDVESRYPGFKHHLYDEDGKLRRFVNIYLNDEDIRYMGGDSVAVKPGDTLDVLPALAGGL